MKSERKDDAVPTTPRRLSKAARRQQLLETARTIIRDAGADRLTLARVAEHAGISKPVVYDHFPTRADLLIELYRWIDVEQIDAFRNAMRTGARSAADTVQTLAAAYIQCASDTQGEFHAVGAALAGSAEKAAVFQELLEHSRQMFISVLEPHSSLPANELARRCIGLVGAGEALSAALVRGTCSEAEAIQAFVPLIQGALGADAAG